MGDLPFDGVAAQRPFVATWNRGEVGSASCSPSQSRSTTRVTAVSGVVRSLGPLPGHTMWEAGAQVQVRGGQRDQLGDAEPGLHGEQQHRVGQLDPWMRPVICFHALMLGIAWYEVVGGVRVLRLPNRTFRHHGPARGSAEIGRGT